MAKILVVDDERSIVELLSSILESRGHEVIAAVDGEEALEKAREQLPDIVVLDLSLPKMDGFEVCERLKADPKTQGIPILMMTAAYDSVQDAERGMEVGADEYITKPFLPQVLIHNIERLVQGRTGSRA